MSENKEQRRKNMMKEARFLRQQNNANMKTLIHYFAYTSEENLSIERIKEIVETKKINN